MIIMVQSGPALCNFSYKYTSSCIRTYYSFVPSLEAGSFPKSSSGVPSAMLDLGARCHQWVYIRDITCLHLSPYITYLPLTVRGWGYKMAINNGGRSGRHNSWRNNDFKQENIKTKPQTTSSKWGYDNNVWVFPESSKFMKETRAIRQFEELQV